MTREQAMLKTVQTNTLEGKCSVCGNVLTEFKDEHKHGCKKCGFFVTYTELHRLTHALSGINNEAVMYFNYWRTLP